MNRGLLSVSFGLLLSCCGGGAHPAADAGPEQAADARAGGDAMRADAAAASCFSGELGPPTNLSAPEGVGVYEACDAPGERVIVLPGSETVDTQVSVSALKEEFSEELLAIEGVVGIGVGLCCGREGAKEACLNVHLQTHTLTMEEVTEELTGVLADRGACLGLRVRLLGWEEPRCDPEEPDCLPFSMCDEIDAACCPELAPYEPEAPRMPVEDETYAHLSGGACANDGECVPLGCGQYCMSYDTPGFVSTCACYPELSTAHCGCVEGECQWFQQPY